MTARAEAGLARLEERAARGDHEAAAVVVILREPWAWGKAARYVDTEGIDFASMLSAHDQEDADDRTCMTWQVEDTEDRGQGCWCGPYFSSGEYLLMRLAWNLWHADKRNLVNVSDLLGTCSGAWLAVAFGAIEARLGRRLPIAVSSGVPA